MKKTWITGITVASVAGTGGAAFAAMQANTHHDSAAAEAPPVTIAEITTTTAGAQSYEFQAGPAGIVHVTAENGVVRIDSALPATGWTLLDYTSPAAHVEARLSDGTQIITFVAELVDGKVVASISGVPVPTVATTAPATEPATTDTSAPVTTQAPVTTPAPQPATPSSEVTTTSQTPAPATTSAPSGSHTATGGDDDGEEHEADDSGEQHESHESEDEGEESDD